MTGFANNLNDAINSGVFLSLTSCSRSFDAIEPMGMGLGMGLEIGLDIGMKKRDLEELLDKGVSERIIADQLVVANRINYLLRNVFGLIEETYFSLGKRMSGNSRHSLVLMCSYGDGSPLRDLKLGRYGGNDLLKGNPVDLMGETRGARRTLREIRSKEGIGSLVINGNYNLHHSGVQLPNVDIEYGGYEDGIERGSKTEAMVAFSKKHPTNDRNPVWFYKLNGDRSIIQSGVEYKLYSSN